MQAWLGEKCDLLEIVQETYIWSCWQMVLAQTKMFPRKLDTNIFWDCEIQPDDRIQEKTRIWTKITKFISHDNNSDS